MSPSTLLGWTSPSRSASPPPSRPLVSHTNQNRRRAPRTSSSSFSTTPDSATSARSVPTSAPRVSMGWPPTVLPSTASTSPRCARPRGRPSSRAATTTPWAWGSWPTSRWASPATTPACRRRRRRCPACCVTPGTRRMAVGKWHLVPRWQRSAAGPFDTWPLGVGFERYYGFLQGDTNHWAPNLVCDNHYIDPPRRPEEGYHLSEDLADQAIADGAGPATGRARASPSSCTSPWAPCMRHITSPPVGGPVSGCLRPGVGTVARGSCSTARSPPGSCREGTLLTERPSWVRAWNDLSAGERRMLARQQEVFAGFLTHTDAQIGGLHLVSRPARGPRRHADHGLLRQRGERRGRYRLGSFNEHRFTAHARESVDANLEHYDDWGGFTTYPHYSWGWAWAGNTPHKLWKRYTWLGGTRTPLIVRWPGPRSRPPAPHGRSSRHGVDLMPTIMAATGLQPPDEVDGIAQRRDDGVSLLSTLEDPACARGAPDAVLRDAGLTIHLPRGLEGDDRTTSAKASSTRRSWPWEAATSRRPSGSCSTSRRTSPRPWTGRPTSRKRCAAWPTCGPPRRSATTCSLSPTDWWTASAGSSRRRGRQGSSRTFLPGGGSVNDESVPMLWGGFRMIAAVDVDGVAADGVIFALGDWFGGYAVASRPAGSSRSALCPGRRYPRPDGERCTDVGSSRDRGDLRPRDRRSSRTSDDEGGRRRGRQDRGSGHAAAGSPARRSRTPSGSATWDFRCRGPTGRRLFSPAPCTPSASRHPGRPHRRGRRGGDRTAQRTDAPGATRPVTGAPRRRRVRAPGAHGHGAPPPRRPGRRSASSRPWRDRTAPSGRGPRRSAHRRAAADRRGIGLEQADGLVPARRSARLAYAALSSSIPRAVSVTASPPAISETHWSPCSCPSAMWCTTTPTGHCSPGTSSAHSASEQDRAKATTSRFAAAKSSARAVPR